MVEHILLIRWKDEARQEAIDNAQEGLRGPKNKIAGIVEVSCGANVSRSASVQSASTVTALDTKGSPQIESQRQRGPSSDGLT